MTPATRSTTCPWRSVTTYDAGSVSLMHNPLAILAGVFDRLGHHEQAATISGFAASPMALAGYPQLEATITHLREVLGDKVYESFAHAGEDDDDRRHGELRAHPHRAGPGSRG